MNATSNRQLPHPRRWDAYRRHEHYQDMDPPTRSDYSARDTLSVSTTPEMFDDEYGNHSGHSSMTTSPPPAKVVAHSSPALSYSSLGEQAPSHLTALPTELLQNIFLHLLLPCLHDAKEGERHLGVAVKGLAAACRTTRSNIIAVLRMLRKEIAVGGLLIDHCARPWEMRVLVLTLDYKLSMGSGVRVKVGPWVGWGSKPAIRERDEVPDGRVDSAHTIRRADLVAMAQERRRRGLLR